MAATSVLCGFVLLQLRPGLILADTTATIGDLGAHVWGPRFIRDHLWDHGLLSGWSPAFFGGLPAYRFYMSVPPLIAVLFDVLLPTAIAFKVAVALPLVMLPAVAARWARASELDFPAAPLVASGSVVFLFDASQTSFGGNIASTVTGEYGFAYGLAAAVLALALVMTAQSRLVHLVRAGMVGGFAAVCHPVAGVFVLLGVLCHVAVAAANDRRREAVSGALVLATVGLLGAFWYVPFWWYRNQLNELGFDKRTDFGEILFPYPVVMELVLVALAAVGMVDAVRHRRRGVLTMALLAAVCAIAVIVLPQGVLSNVRMSPMWNLGRLMLSGCGAAVVVVAGVSRLPKRRRPAGLIGAPLAAVGLVLFVVSYGTGTLPLGTATESTLAGWRLVPEYRWAAGPTLDLNPNAQLQRVAFAGMERGPKWHEYRSVVATLADVGAKRGCGRIAVEHDPVGQYGSLYAFNLVPLFTDDCITDIAGLLRDSSVTADAQMVAESSYSAVAENYKPGLPYGQVDLERASVYLRELGVRYYMASTPEIVAAARRTAGFGELVTDGQWTIFAIEQMVLVEPLGSVPHVASGAGDDRERWSELAIQWFVQADLDAVRVAADGPSSWPRSEGVPPESAPPPDVTVGDLVEGDGEISFSVDRLGVPMLVRVSYFPTWRVEGADGPWRVSPNWMVVVPTSNDVRLINDPSVVEIGSSIVSLIALAGCLAVVGRSGWQVGRRRFGANASTQE